MRLAIIHQKYQNLDFMTIKTIYSATIAQHKFNKYNIFVTIFQNKLFINEIHYNIECINIIIIWKHTSKTAPTLVGTYSVVNLKILFFSDHQ